MSKTLMEAVDEMIHWRVVGVDPAEGENVTVKGYINWPNRHTETPLVAAYPYDPNGWGADEPTIVEVKE